MSRPNVLIFMIDTFRPDHLEPWGPSARPTPNFAQLAREGVFFRTFFAHMPSSHPSRASVLTGRDPHTCGIRINSVPLPASETTLAQILRDAGYLTALTRKHALPPGLDRGFEETDLVPKYFAGGARPWEIAEEIPPCSEQEARMDTPQDVAAVIRWLKEYLADPEKRRRPFFLWADVEDVHGAWKAPPPFDALYVEKEWDGPDLTHPPLYAPDMPPEHKARAIAHYDQMVTFMDKYIGILTDALECLGLADETLLIVMSDHAGAMGEHHMWGKMYTVYDPVLRSVLIMRYPKVIPPAAQTDGLALMNDVFATVLDIAGMDVPDAARPHCISLRPLWEGAPQVREWIPMEFNLFKGTAVKAIRTERWKYIYYRSLGEILWSAGISPAEIHRREGWNTVQLFDLANDPGEMRNVVGEYPEVAQEMQWRLINWLIDSENTLPAKDAGR